MKTLFLWMLVLGLLLVGCTVDNPDITQVPTTELTTLQPTVGTNPSLYVPRNPVEILTDGVVSAYSLDKKCTGIAFMGDQLLLFFRNGVGSTTLCMLDESNERIAWETVLSDDLPTNHVQINQKECAYYSAQENCIVVLNNTLRESFRVSMPEDMVGIPVIREDLTEAYYCAGTEIRAINLETELSRLLRQRNCQEISIDRILFSDKVLLCTVTEANGNRYAEFISTETGETLGADADLLAIDTWENRYLLLRKEGAIRESLFGSMDEAVQCIEPESSDTLWDALSMDGAVAVSDLAEGGISLQLYDLTSGQKSSEVQIPCLYNVTDLVADPSGDYLWFVSRDSHDKDTLYRWDLLASAVKDSAIYTAQRYTADTPDLAGLAQCRAYADSLEAQYNIAISIEQDTVLLEDYTYTYEYHAQAINLGLRNLEKALSAFPEGFLTTLGDLSKNGKIHISLVRDMTGRSGAVPAEANGFQYWSDGSAYIVLSIGEGTERAFYHALSLVLDTYVLNESLAFDDWEQWNPKDFSYDENYKDYAAREDLTWLEGEERAFADAFSMTFPKEDRARIFEYAMMEDNREVFQSETMQRKLYQVCKGIRDAFGWKKDERTFPWEQYLSKSLAYTKK